MAGFQIISTDMRRMWRAWRARAPEMRDYYRHDYPTGDTPWTKVEFLSVDLETTGLDLAKDRVVSIGWVPVIDGAVQLSGARHHVVRPDRTMSAESVAIHGIFDSAVEVAPAMGDILPHFLAALAGRVLIAHHDRIERHFLNLACIERYACGLDVASVDTLALARRLVQNRGKVARAGDFRLAACRETYGLPRYKAHNALVDALATAELFLAQAADIGGGKPVRLDALLTHA